MATKLYFSTARTHPGAPIPTKQYDVVRTVTINTNLHDAMNDVNGERAFALFSDTDTIPSAFFTERATTEFTISGPITFYVSYEVGTGVTAKLRIRLSKITVGGSDVETPILTADAPSNFAVGHSFVTFSGTPPTSVVVYPNERLVFRFFALPGDGSSYGTPGGTLSIYHTPVYAAQDADEWWVELTEDFTLKDNGSYLYFRRTNTIGIDDFLDMLEAKGSSAFTTAVAATMPSGTRVPLTQTQFPVTWAPVELTAAGIASTSNAASYVSPSFTPVANRLYLLGVVHSDAAPEATVPTITGTTGLTFVQVGSSTPYNTIASNIHRLTVFRALKTSGLSAGTYTVNLADAGTGCIAQILEYPTGAVVTTGADGADAVRNIVSSNGDASANPTLTMGSYLVGYNSLAMFVASEATGTTAGSGWSGSTNPTYATPSTALFAQWRQGAPSTAPVTQASGDWAALAVEVVTATPPATVEWISPRIGPLGFVSAAGSFRLQINANESDALANAGLLVEIYHRTPSGTDTLVATCNTTELSTSASFLTITAALVLAKAFTEDTRFVCRAFVKNVGTMAGAHSVTVQYDGNGSLETRLVVWDSPAFKAEADPPATGIIPSGGALSGVSNGQ